jgi:pimeloyl-ACP methyl ester carboxylesterase
VAPLAEELSVRAGVLEPFQAADTVDGQLAELNELIDREANWPVQLIGHSWGAWLSMIYAASFPDKMIRLIMIGSGPFTPEYVSRISVTRNSRLGESERAEFARLEMMLTDPSVPDKELLMKRFSTLVHMADSFDPYPFRDCCVAYQPDIFQSVWTGAAEFRRNGELIRKAGEVTCPVIVIHGNEDPHPWQGVIEPLQGKVRDIKFFRLDHCGHEPWNERQARDKFFRLLKEHIKNIS